MFDLSGSLVSALNSHEITEKEFADAVYFLAPEAAQLAMAMLSTTWAHNEDTNQRRSEARQVCRTSTPSALSLN